MSENTITKLFFILIVFNVMSYIISNMFDKSDKKLEQKVSEMEKDIRKISEHDKKIMIQTVWNVIIIIAMGVIDMFYILSYE